MEFGFVCSESDQIFFETRIRIEVFFLQIPDRIRLEHPDPEPWFMATYASLQAVSPGAQMGSSVFNSGFGVCFSAIVSQLSTVSWT